jgi:hypothetical protein
VCANILICFAFFRKSRIHKHSTFLFSAPTEKPIQSPRGRHSKQITYERKALAWRERRGLCSSRAGRARRGHPRGGRKLPRKRPQPRAAPSGPLPTQPAADEMHVAAWPLAAGGITLACRGRLASARVALLSGAGTLLLAALAACGGRIALTCRRRLTSALVALLSAARALAAENAARPGSALLPCCPLPGPWPLRMRRPRLPEGKTEGTKPRGAVYAAAAQHPRGGGAANH